LKDFLVLDSSRDVWDYVDKWFRAATYILPKPNDDVSTVLHFLKARNLVLTDRNEQDLIVHSYLWELAKLWQGWTFFDFSIPDYNEAYAFLCEQFGVEEMNSATKSYLITCNLNLGEWLDKAKHEIGFFSLQWLEMYNEFKELVNGKG
jgi:hypothetical protein